MDFNGFLLIILLFIAIPTYGLISKYDDRLLRTLGKGFNSIKGTTNPMSVDEVISTWNTERILSFEHDADVYVIEHPSYEMTATGKIATEFNYNTDISFENDVTFEGGFDFSKFTVVVGATSTYHAEIYSEARLAGKAVFVIKQKQSLATAKLERGWINPRFVSRVHALPSDYISGRDHYIEFIEDFGTHFVKQVVAGGFFIAMLTMNWDFYSTHKTELDAKLLGEITGPSIFGLISTGKLNIAEFFGKLDINIDVDGEMGISSNVDAKVFLYGGDIDMDFYNIAISGQDPFTRWSETVESCPAAISVVLESYLDLIKDEKKRNNMKTAIIDYFFDSTRIPSFVERKEISVNIFKPELSSKELYGCSFSTVPYSNSISIINGAMKGKCINDEGYMPLSQYAFENVFDTMTFPIFREFESSKFSPRHLKIDVENFPKPILMKQSFSTSDCYGSTWDSDFDGKYNRCSKKCPEGYKGLGMLYNANIDGFGYDYGCVLSSCVTTCGCSEDIYKIDLHWKTGGLLNKEDQHTWITFKGECSTINHDVVSSGAFNLEYINIATPDIDCIKKSCVNNRDMITYEYLSNHIAESLKKSTTPVVLYENSWYFIDYQIIDCKPFDLFTFAISLIFAGGIITMIAAIVVGVSGCIIIALIIAIVVIVIVIVNGKKKRGSRKRNSLDNENGFGKCLWNYLTFFCCCWCCCKKKKGKGYKRTY